MAKRVLATTLVTALTGLFFSFLAAMSLYHSETVAIEHEIQKDVENAALSLGREINIGIELLYSVQNHFDGNNELTADNFHRVTNNLLDRHPNIRILEWAEVVTEEQKALYIAEADIELGGTFGIIEQSPDGGLVQATVRNRYFPIKYSSAGKGGGTATGFDLGSSPAIRQALEMSWYRGVPIATPAVRLKREFDDRNGFMVVLPVFLGAPETDADRQSALRGFLLAVFDVKDIFQLAISNTVNESINLELIDRGLNRESQVIHSNIVELSVPAMENMSYQSQPIFFAGRVWVIRGTPTLAYVQTRLSLMPYLLFLVGVVIFSLLAYLLYVLQHRAISIQKRVDQKTRALREANLKLEQMSKCDGLTGRYNRNYFDECVESEVRRSQRNGTPLSMMVIEIDRMSAFNERHGRVAGDKSLRLVSLALADILKRPGDLLSRYGGEQFAVLLPNTKDAEPMATQCLEAVRALKLPFDKDEGSSIITVSVGGVTVNDVDVLSASKLAAYAEVALGKAISAGRNGTHWIVTPDNAQVFK